MSQKAPDREMHTPPARPTARVYVSAILAVILILAGVYTLWQGTRGSSSNQGSAGRLSTPASQLEAAPDFSLQALDGRTVRLSDYRGQVVLLNIWATWCPPCRDEMPDLEAYYRQHQEDGFVVLAVNSQEGAETVATFLEDYDFTFPVLLDPDGVVVRDYGALGLPTSFFIDREGMLRGVWVGKLSPARLKELVDPLL